VAYGSEDVGGNRKGITSAVGLGAASLGHGHHQFTLTGVAGLEHLDLRGHTRSGQSGGDLEQVLGGVGHRFPCLVCGYCTGSGSDELSSRVQCVGCHSACWWVAVEEHANGSDHDELEHEQTVEVRGARFGQSGEHQTSSSSISSISSVSIRPSIQRVPSGVIWPKLYSSAGIRLS